MPVLMMPFLFKGCNRCMNLAIFSKHIDDSISKTTYLIMLERGRFITRVESFAYMPLLMKSFPFKGDKCHVNLAMALREWDFLYGSTMF